MAGQSAAFAHYRAQAKDGCTPARSDRSRKSFLSHPGIRNALQGCPFSVGLHRSGKQDVFFIFSLSTRAESWSRWAWRMGAGKVHPTVTACHPSASEASSRAAPLGPALAVTFYQPHLCLLCWTGQTYNQVSPAFSADRGPALVLPAGPFPPFPATSWATHPAPSSGELRFPAMAPFVLLQVCLGPKHIHG